MVHCFDGFTTVFNTVSGERLRDGLYGVSNAGKKKGRARRSGKKIGDLNRGQTLGSGKIFPIIYS